MCNAAVSAPPPLSRTSGSFPRSSSHSSSHAAVRELDAGASPAISIHHLGNVGATKSERAGISKLKSDMKLVGGVGGRGNSKTFAFNVKNQLSVQPQQTGRAESIPFLVLF